MEFTITTTFDQKTMTALARGLRKTIRRKSSKRSHGFGFFTLILSGIILLGTSEFTFRAFLTLLAAVCILAGLIWEDALNGYFARKRGLPGLDTYVTIFREDGYRNEMDLGSSDFFYAPILRLARCGNYLVLVYSQSHAQVYDLTTLSGGTQEEFLSFLMQKTGKELETV